MSPAIAAGSPRAALRAAQAALADAGVPDADFDARELFRFATGRSPYADAPLTPAEAARLAELCRARAGRTPLQYLLGEWDFLDFTLKVGPGVLCPRADTEVVAEAALALLAGSGLPAPRVLDLCAGSGCLGLGIRRFCPNAQVTCVEKSPQALGYLRQNAAAALAPFGIPAPGAAVVQADVFAFYKELAPGGVDLIVSNPPYLTAPEMAALMPETAREPAMALAGGADGLDFYRCLVRDYRAALAPGGAMVLEIGCAQAQAVCALALAAGWGSAVCRKDYGGNDRAVVLQQPAAAQETE